MPRFAVVFVAAAILFCGGCHKSAQSLADESIAVMNEMADALESGDQGKLQKLSERSAELGKKMQALSPEEAQKVFAAKQDEMMKATMRMMAAAQKSKLAPDILKAMQMAGGTGKR